MSKCVAAAVRGPGELWAYVAGIGVLYANDCLDVGLNGLERTDVFPLYVLCGIEACGICAAWYPNCGSRTWCAAAKWYAHSCRVSNCSSQSMHA